MAAGLLFLAATPANVRPAVQVDMALVLALDVSSSVDAREYDLQQRGLANAFRHAKVIDAILAGPNQRIAVSVVQWAGGGEQSVSIPWTTVGSSDEALAFAERLSQTPRRFRDGVTDIAGIITYSAQHALAGPFATSRRVIDVSGDGIDNVQYSPHRARDAAVAAGITINGLAILNETPDLDDYYRLTVIGGENAFVMTAASYEDYAPAILRKLIREIRPRRLSWGGSSGVTAPPTPL